MFNLFLFVQQISTDVSSPVQNLILGVRDAADDKTEVCDQVECVFQSEEKNKEQ